MFVSKLFRTRIGKVVAAAVIIAAAMALSGCGASLSFYDYTDNGIRYNMYELSIDRDVVDKMESSAAVDADGNKYDVANYFYDLFNGFGYEVVSSTRDDEAFTARYRRAVGNNPELYSVGTQPRFTATYSQNLFVRSYTATSQNPFNGVRRAYDEILPDTSSTVLQKLKNGVVTIDEFNERTVEFPAVTDAFPYLKSVSPDGLLLNYVYTGSKRMTSSGREREHGDYSEYVFSRYFDNSPDATMTLGYKRPVPVGWYLAAVVAGAGTVAVFVLVTRKKKEKPTLLDRFPYDPEEYRDYESRLPMKK